MAGCVLCPLKSYRNFFGAPGTGVHRFRLFDVAAIDYLLTLLVAMATTWSTGMPLMVATIGWLVLGVVMHMLFGVNTHAIRWLGLSC
jgi:hypothetical protein